MVVVVAWVFDFVWVFNEFQFGYWVLFGFGFELAVLVVGGVIGLLGGGGLGLSIGFCLSIGFGFESVALVVGGAIVALW